MNVADLVSHVSRGLYLALMLSLPAILVAAIVGTLFAIIQALTQIQEQTLSFALKLIVTVFTLWLTMRWMGGEIFHYTQILLDLVPLVGR